MAEEHFHYPQHGVNEFTRLLNEQLSTQVKLLLEDRHLYQKVTIDVDRIRSEILKRIYEHDLEWAEERIASLLNERLVLTSGSGVMLVPRGEAPKPTPMLALPAVRLFCGTCSERHVFKPVWYQDATQEMMQRVAKGGEGELKFNVVGTQLFFVAYQCQHCQGEPQGFLIRRQGWRFGLDGRSPIEEIQIPAYVPKKEKYLYRDAMIARFAGKQLAATFYLRAFIEQFARRQTGMKGRETGDEIMAAYASVLPGENREQMPSLREWYGKLSVPIHTADEAAAEALFDTAREEIERHFDIRRVFKIAEKRVDVD
jgi:hypothetical protein